MVGRLVQQQQVRRRNSTVASATRMRQPPENSSSERSCASASKPSPARMMAARAGAASAPMVCRRSNTAATRSGGSSPRSARAASASKARRSGSPSSTVSSRVAAPDGAVCLTWAMRARDDRRISPPSTVMSPAMAFNNVDLPAPLRPTSPMRRPGSTVKSAPSSRVRPPMRSVTPVQVRRLMRAFCRNAAKQSRVAIRGKSREAAA